MESILFFLFFMYFEIYREQFSRKLFEGILLKNCDHFVHSCKFQLEICKLQYTYIILWLIADSFVGEYSSSHSYVTFLSLENHYYYGRFIKYLSLWMFYRKIFSSLV